MRPSGDRRSCRRVPPLHPHWEEPGGTYFITFVLKRPPVVDLTKPEVAQLMVGALLHFDCERYWLYDYTLMPDHVHAILKPIDTDGTSEPLHAITHSLKSWTANQINELLGREGAVWQQETHDHIIRNQADYLEKAGYIYDNPYDKHLVPFGEEWPWWGRGRSDTA